MDWNIGWVFWIGCSYFLTIVNCYFVLVKKAKYNYIIGVSGIAFFSVALLEELRMFSQWIEDGEVGMLTHALQNLPIQFTIRFLIVVGITTLLIINRSASHKKVLIQTADYNHHEYAIELLP